MLQRSRFAFIHLIDNKRCKDWCEGVSPKTLGNNSIIPKKAAVKSAPKKNTGRSMLHSPAPNYGGLPMGLNRYKPLTGLQLLQQSKSQKRRKQRRATRKNRSRK